MDSLRDQLPYNLRRTSKGLNRSTDLAIYKIHKKERLLKEVEEKLESLYKSDGFGFLIEPQNYR